MSSSDPQSLDVFVYHHLPGQPKLTNDSGEYNRFRLFGWTKEYDRVCVVVHSVPIECYLEIRPTTTFCWQSEHPNGWLDCITAIRKELHSLKSILETEQFARNFQKSQRSKWDYLNIDTVERILSYPARVRWNEARNKYDRVETPLLKLTFPKVFSMRNFVNYMQQTMRMSYGSNYEFVLHETEAFIDLPMRCFAARNMPQSGWMRITNFQYGDKVEGHHACNPEFVDPEYDIQVAAQNISMVPESERLPSMAPRTLMVWDIETFSSQFIKTGKLSMPRPDLADDCIFQISAVFVNGWDSASDPPEKHLWALKHPDQAIVGEDVNIHYCKDERELLLSFLKEAEDADIDAGWNTMGYDINYVYQRALFNKCDGALLHVGWVSDIPGRWKESAFESKAHQAQNFKYAEREGHLSVDMLPIIRRDYKFDNYKLGTVLNKFNVSLSKVDLTAKQLFEKFHSGTDKEVGEVGFYCCPSGTLISLSDGTSLPIEKVKEGMNVLSRFIVDDISSGGLVSREVNSVIEQGLKPCMELLFSDGRTLTCTPDHRILTVDGTWVEAQNLTVDVSEVSVGLENPHVERTPIAWKMDLTDSLGQILDFEENAEKCLALCRIIGYALSDGTVCDAGTALFLGHFIDVQTLMRDIQLLTNLQPSVRQNTNNACRVLWVPKKLHLALLSFGISTGKRKSQICRFPAFLMDEKCPIPLIQEFLGGLYGGDGSAPSLTKNGKDSLRIANAIKYTTVRTGAVALQQATILTSELSQLFERVGLSTKSFKYYMHRMGPNRMTDVGKKEFDQLKDTGEVIYKTIKNADEILETENYCIVVVFDTTQTINFSKKVGFRYCCHKQTRLTAAVSWVRSRDFIAAQKKTIRELSEIIRSNPANEKRISIKKSVELAKIDLSTKTILHPAVQKWSPYKTEELQADRVFLPPSIFLEQTDTRKFFSSLNKNEKRTVTYGVHQSSKYIPMFKIRLIGKRDVGEKIVYDLSVPSPQGENSCSFLANGVCVHNCVVDSLSCYLLWVKVGMWHALLEMSYQTMVFMLKLFTGGTQIQTAAQAVAHLWSEHKVLGCMKKFDPNSAAKKKEGQSREKQYVGATVFEANPGIYRFVVVLDFASLYPSIMRGRNLDFGTYVLDVLHPSGRDPTIPDEKCNVMHWQEHQSCEHDPNRKRLKNGEFSKAKGKAVVCKEQYFRWLKEDYVGEGLLPNILTTALASRKATKKLMGAEQKNLFKYIVHWIRVYFDSKHQIPEKSDYEPLNSLPIFNFVFLAGQKETTAQVFLLSWEEIQVFVEKNPVVLNCSEADAISTVEELIRSTTTRITILDKIQLAHKIRANSIYGATGAPEETGMISMQHIAACTTWQGRTWIKFVAEMARDKYGATLVYGDTDSVFLTFPKLISTHKDPKKAKEETIANLNALIGPMLKDINSHFPKQVSLEFEKVFEVMVLLSKKRYFGNLQNERGVFVEFLKRGCALVRRDFVPLVKQLYKTISDRLLQEVDDILRPDDSLSEQENLTDLRERFKLWGRSIVDAINDGILAMFRRSHPYTKFILSRGISKPRSGYKASGTRREPNHILLWDRIEERQDLFENGLRIKAGGNIISSGTRIEYVAVDVPTAPADQQFVVDKEAAYEYAVKDKLQVACLEELDYFLEWRSILRLNYLWYLEHQVEVPFEELVEVIFGKQPQDRAAPQSHHPLVLTLYKRDKKLLKKSILFQISNQHTYKRKLNEELLRVCRPWYTDEKTGTLYRVQTDYPAQFLFRK